MKNIKLSRYKKLKRRIEKAMKEGHFFRYTRKRQAQLLARLQRYYQQLLRKGQLVAPLTALLLGSGTLTQAQTFTEITDTASPFIDVAVNAPFGITDIGSFSSPDFVDIDGDGDLDAFVGERDGNINYYENIGDSENPSFSLQSTDGAFGLSDIGFDSSPDFVDIDGDGDLDAFVGEEDGNINYYENIGDSENPSFSLQSTNGAFGLSDIGYSSSPDFVDIDGDGDLDVFIGEYYGRTRYFENTSANSSVPAYTLSTSTAPFGLGDVGYYASPNFVDIDGDGDFDVFVGEEYGRLEYFENIGDAQNPAFVRSISTAPFGLGDVGYYASPDFADIDGDGDMDAFIGGSNGKTNYFKNTSINSSIPAFIQDCIVDVGFAANPSFVDIDGDGDLDLFVGENNKNINYFENTSTDGTLPVFTLQSTDNPFGLSDATYGLRADLSFVDIDDDGDLDAFMGTFYGNTNYYENTSTDSSIPAFTLRSTNGAFGLSTGGYYATPTFVDIDGDGDFDAFVGEENGLLDYFENTGDAQNPAFVKSTSTVPFGLTDVGDDSVPYFVDIDDDGDFDAFIGKRDGNISYFENSGTDAASPAFTLQSANNAFGLSDVGDSAVPVILDLDGDGLFEAIIGSGEGTLVYFESDIQLLDPLAGVAINEDNGERDASAMLDISSSNKGILIPRMTTAQRNGISNPSVGLTIFNLDDNCTDIYNGSTWMKDCALVQTSSNTYQVSNPSNGLIANSLLNDIDNDTKIQVEESSDEDVIRFDVGGTEALLIDASSDLHATGDISANAFIGDGSQLTNLNVDDADADPANEFNTNVVLNGANLEITDGGGTLSADLSGLFTDADWTIGINKVYNLNDNIGIGESNPQTTLDVVDQAVIGNIDVGTQSNDQSTSNANGDGFITTPWLYTNAIEAQGERGTASTLITLGNDGTYGMADEIHFVTFGISRMQIDANGYLGIGQDPNTDIHLRQSADTQGGTGGLTYEKSDDPNYFWKTYHSGINLSFALNRTRRGYINPSGTWVVTSDRRLKNSVQAMSSTLERVLQLRPVSYRYHHQDSDAQKTLGFIAQEVQPLFPEMVVTGKDEYLGMTYSDAGVIALKTIQEQQAIIKEEQEKYEALAKKYELLKVKAQAQGAAFEQQLRELEMQLKEE